MGWPQTAAPCDFSLAAVEREEFGFLGHPKDAVITGAFSYTGRYVAKRLLGQGVSIRTLTRSRGSVGNGGAGKR